MPFPCCPLHAGMVDKQTKCMKTTLGVDHGLYVCWVETTKTTTITRKQLLSTHCMVEWKEKGGAMGVATWMYMEVVWSSEVKEARKMKEKERWEAGAYYTVAMMVCCVYIHVIS
jgi:hypothetical protein